jgi:hypothetical protein
MDAFYISRLTMKLHMASGTEHIRWITSHLTYLLYGGVPSRWRSNLRKNCSSVIYKYGREKSTNKTPSPLQIYLQMRLWVAMFFYHFLFENAINKRMFSRNTFNFPKKPCVALSNLVRLPLFK